MQASKADYPALLLPRPPGLQVRTGAGAEECFDEVRRIWVEATPEEWVRQHVVNWLIRELRIPSGLIAVERGLRVHDLSRRTDIVVADRTGRPWMLIECKAAGVGLSQDAVDQAITYNTVVQAQYVMITDGNEMRAWQRSPRGSYRPVNDVPTYPEKGSQSA